MKLIINSKYKNLGKFFYNFKLNNYQLIPIGGKRHNKTSLYIIKQGIPDEISPLLVRKYDKRFLIPALGARYTRNTPAKDFQLAQKLNSKTSLTPQVYAYKQYKQSAFIKSGLLFMQYLEPYQTFREYFTKAQTTQTKRQALQYAMDFLIYLNQQNLLHLDYQGINILIQKKQWYIIDFEEAYYTPLLFKILDPILKVIQFNRFASSRQRIPNFKFQNKYAFIYLAKKLKWSRLKTRVLSALLNKKFM